jgi:RNA polymerase sigma-70 factor (ECF subfamily)
MSARWRKGADDLASEVFDQYSPALRRYLLSRLRDRAQQAQDLEQEVYLRLLRVPDAELVRDPQAYMYRIASHVVFEFKQRARDHTVTFDSEMVNERTERPDSAARDDLEERLSAERQLESLLKVLPPRCRSVFVLHMRDGMTHAEVAEELGISVHSVKKHVFRAFETLRAEIRGAKCEL